VRSVTISTGAVTFANCTQGGSSTPGLSLPNGTCDTNTANGTITLTNSGNVAGHINVLAGDAVPSDGGTHWTLCGGAGGPACAGSTPGANQYQERTVKAGSSSGVVLANGAQCDAALEGSSCQPLAPGASGSEYLAITAPASSSDTSSSYHTTVTWIASP